MADRTDDELIGIAEAAYHQACRAGKPTLRAEYRAVHADGREQGRAEERERIRALVVERLERANKRLQEATDPERRSIFFAMTTALDSALAAIDKRDTQPPENPAAGYGQEEPPQAIITDLAAVLGVTKQGGGRR